MANGHGSKISRLAFVDGLRALAILTVFITHGTEQLGPASTHGALLTRIAYDLNFGRVGVVIFFAVSGFLIPSSLRGEAGDRQIQDAKVGLAHVIGLGSACGVHVLEKSTA